MQRQSMQHLAPYRTGLWLAEYLSIRCQLCRVHRSTSQHSADTPNSFSDSLPSNHALIANLRHFFDKRLNHGLLCSHCHQSISWLPKPFQIDIAAGNTLSIQAATYYDYPMRQAIRAFKHSEDTTKLPLLLHALRQLPRPHGCHHDNSVIVAMPTTAQRLVKRGFDPVSILSAHLSKHWQIPLWHGVQRIDNTISQQGLTRADRLSNLDNAFALTDKPPVKRLILFDDVATTGASLQALGHILHRSFSVSPPDHPQTFPECQIFAYALAHGSQ